MKKILLGCSAVFVLALLGVGLGVYFFIWAPISTVYQELTGFAESYERIEAGVDNQRPYQPPADEHLSRSQVERFVRVQRDIREDLGELYQRMDDKYHRTGGESLGLTEIAEFWSDMGNLILEAKRAQVVAINREGFSPQEYRWVRREFYRALGAEFANHSLEKLTEAIRNQDLTAISLEDAKRSASSQVPEENLELVRPYRNEWQEWVGFAWLGI